MVSTQNCNNWCRHSPSLFLSPQLSTSLLRLHRSSYTIMAIQKVPTGPHFAMTTQPQKHTHTDTSVPCSSTLVATEEAHKRLNVIFLIRTSFSTFLLLLVPREISPSHCHPINYFVEKQSTLTHPHY